MQDNIKPKKRRRLIKLYTGIDLHSNNNYVAIMDHTGKKIFSGKTANDPQAVLEELAPYRG